MSAKNIPLPLFSVIVPTSNRIDLLCNALLSIKAQSFLDYEVIVVDDGSSQPIRDSYPALWEKLDVRFKIHLIGDSGSERKGPSYTRNYGIKNSNSKYVAFLDDDDIWSDNSHLEITAYLLKNNEDVDLYIANQKGVMNGITKTPNWLQSYKDKFNKWKKIEHAAYFAEKADLLTVKEFPHLNIFILKRSFQQKVGLLNENLSYCEDLEYTIRSIDLSKKIIFRSSIVSTLNIPDRTLNNNASTRLSEIEKQRVYIYISSILCSKCTTINGISRGKMLAGWAYKTLAHDAAYNKRYKVASHFAKLGSCAWLTIPFLRYNIYWTIRSLFSKT